MPLRLTLCCPLSSEMAAGLVMLLSVGASFTAFTVRLKVSLAVAVPSLTVTVMVAEPL